MLQISKAFVIYLKLVGWLVDWFIHSFHLSVHCRFSVSRHCSRQWDSNVAQVPLFAKACDLLISGFVLSVSVQFSSVQLLSCVWLFATPWTAARQASLSIINYQFTQTHVHWVSDAIWSSHPLSSPSPPALNLSQHQDLFKWVSSSHQVAKVLESQLQHQSVQWTPRTDLL